MQYDIRALEYGQGYENDENSKIERHCSMQRPFVLHESRIGSQAVIEAEKGKAREERSHREQCFGRHCYFPNSYNGELA